MSDSCATCKFYIEHSCRRHAPSVTDTSWDHPTYGKQFEMRAIWPETAPDQWCGDFERAAP